MNTIPTREQLLAIKSKCNPTLTAHENWLAINAEMVPNPVPAKMVPKPMVGIELFKLLSQAASRAKIADWVVLQRLVDGINAQDYADVLDWIQMAVGVGKIAPDEAGKAMKYVTDRRDGIETRPDPAWPPEVTWPVANPLFGEPIPFMWIVEAMA